MKAAWRAGWLALCLVVLAGCRALPFGERQLLTDVCVYGATSAGVTAAIAARQQGLTVTLVDCDGQVGGMTTSGLGATDVGNQQAIGGLARSFYRRLRAHYDRPAAWTRQRREDFAGRGLEPGGDAAWAFEPSAAMATFAWMLAEAGITPVVARLDRRPGGVRKDGSRILWLDTEDGRRVVARMFLDCTYEGDLLAAAGCEFAVGRESNGRHAETWNGVQTKNATHHQFTAPVDPYVVKGDKKSGLLPGIDPGGPGVEGSGDARLQAYCFRLCTTDVPENRVAWRRPADYDARDYELLLRHFDAGSTMAPWHPVAVPNRKTDTNNNGAFSTDLLGGSQAYATADYATRERIVASHRRYQEGLLWTLANDLRVPAKVRAEFQRFGLCRDEFVGCEYWPPRLYVREGRRLVGETVVTEHHCMGREVAVDPVGLGAYAMDSHNVQRYVAADGTVRNEGDVQVPVPAPYGISYRALLPQRAHASNLLVPVCVSSSHIAYGSIRMEPVFMVLAESAMRAGALALQLGVAVQDVPYPLLREQLLAAGQVLAWPVER